jgi:hypothetical protein
MGIEPTCRDKGSTITIENGVGNYAKCKFAASGRVDIS